MTLEKNRKSTRVTSTTLKQLAEVGVDRAIAARTSVGGNVPTEQINQISGGFSLKEWSTIIGGLLGQLGE